MDTVDSITNQYLTFNLGADEYALDIKKVREVLDYTEVTRVPRMPDYLCGVINLRGNVVPVVDLRQKLGMSATERSVNTCIVITEVGMEGECVHVGVLADSVHEVLDLGPDQIQPPPKFGMGLDVDFIRGMGRRNSGFLIILDIDRVLTEDAASGIYKAAEAA